MAEQAPADHRVPQLSAETRAYLDRLLAEFPPPTDAQLATVAALLAPAARDQLDPPRAS